MPLVPVGELMGSVTFDASRLGSQETVDPRKYLVPAREAVAGTVAGFLRVVSG
ncbi:hypothetical protein [Streptomyces sp. DW26H14]|uniref:hypothetical protein n=1 Tax=Streptomyces sp. DW26H14 TaxID=3435395 RepID=UPI00403DEBFF